jgi:hypothetical protein
MIALIVLSPAALAEEQTLAVTTTSVSSGSPTAGGYQKLSGSLLSEPTLTGMPSHRLFEGQVHC